MPNVNFLADPGGLVTVVSTLMAMLVSAVIILAITKSIQCNENIRMLIMYGQMGATCSHRLLQY